MLTNEKPQIDEKQQFLDRYRILRTIYGVRAKWAFNAAKDNRSYWRMLESCLAEENSKKVKRVKLNAEGVLQIEKIAEYHGVSAREFMEALMHFAISTDKRPGSWEAQGFDFANYDKRNENAFADRWF